MKTFKKITLTIIMIVFGFITVKAQVAININGADPDASAMLDVVSTTKGMLVPRMSQMRRDLIGTPAPGLLIYQTNNTPGFYFYNGTSWNLLIAGAISIDDLSDGKTGGNSVFLGTAAGANDDGTDNQNVAVGDSSLYSNTAGSANTATGYRALYKSKGGSNTAIGYQALYNDSIGYQNTAVGYHALKSNKTGSSNIAIGIQSLDVNTSGFSNVAIGFSALGSNETGSMNTAIGNSALLFNTASKNTAIGHSALLRNTTGTGNTAIGYKANKDNNTGSNNTIIGYEASMGTDWNPHPKQNNVIIGYQAGYNVGNGSDANIFIGYQAGYNETGNNKLYIENSNSSSPLIGGDFSADEVYLNGDVEINGDVGISTSAPTAKLDVNGSTGYDQLRMRTSYTPTGPGDSNGNMGDIAWDENYIYIKTSACCWKRAAIVAW